MLKEKKKDILLLVPAVSGIYTYSW